MTDESSMSVIRITLRCTLIQIAAVLICLVCDLGVLCWSRLTGCIYTVQIHLTWFRKPVPEYEYLGGCKCIMQSVRDSNVDFLCVVSHYRLSL